MGKFEMKEKHERISHLEEPELKTPMENIRVFNVPGNLQIFIHSLQF